MGQNINESYYKKPDDDLIKKIADKIPLPYIKELGYYGITEEGEILEILSYIFGKELKRRKNTGRWFTLSDKENRVIYAEVINGDESWVSGTWMVYKYEDGRFPKKWTKLISSTGDLTTKEYSEDGDVHSTSYGEIEKIPTRITESVDEDRHKRYLDKVLEHLVKGTKIELNVGYNFEGLIVYMPFDENPPEFMNVNDYHETSSMFSAIPSFMFSRYCINHFGLVKEEINYVWDEYSEIMSKKFKSELNKIKNGE